MTSFLELHRPGDPLLLPNAWDAGSARLLTSLGFHALATTSSGAATAVGRLDGSLGLAGSLANAESVVAVTDLPVTADFENAFADDADGLTATVAAARAAGLAGLSIEDVGDGEVYAFDRAVERVGIAAAAAHAGPTPLVLTARAENHLHGRPDLADTVARLQAFAAAGADVVYAPGLTDPGQIRTLVAEVGAPVNVLALPGLASVAALADAGVARISVGGAFAFLAYGAAVDAARRFAAGELDWAPSSRQASAAVQQLLGS